MKLGPVSKIDKRNKTNLKNFDADVMSKVCDFIFPIYGQFGAMQNPDFGWIFCKTYIFIDNNFLSYKN